MSLVLLISYLRHGWGAIAAWGGSLFLYGLFLASLYQETVRAFSTTLKQYLEAIPEPFMALMGASGTSFESLFDPSGAFTLEGYLGTQYTAFWPIMLGVWAAVSLGGAISREVERNTIDLVLAQPLPRYHLVVTKFARYLLALAAVTVAAHLGVVLGFHVANIAINDLAVFMALAEGSLLALAFGAISLLFSCRFLDPRRSVMFSALLLAGFYMLNIFAPVFAPPLDSLGRLSPFRYYESLRIL